MVLSQSDFVDVVVTGRDLVVTSAYDHVCRLEPRESDLAWYCDLDDGTPTDTERDPATSVRWVCPAFRVGRSATGTVLPPFEVGRPGPHSDLGRLMKGLRRLARPATRQMPGDDVEGRFAYTDPAGIIDDALRWRIENWPSAQYADGVARPAELWSIQFTGDGLVVLSVSWWNSAPALDHQIGLGLEIAHRLHLL